MRVKRLSIDCLLMLLVAIGCSSVAVGQIDMRTALYGRGVHAYFAGSMNDAANHFNSAISLGTRDPRVYYFRGLTYLREGRQYEAEADFDQAAQLEYQGITTANVGRALERVQGHQRLQLEKVRRQTHAMLAQQRALESPQTPVVPTPAGGDPLRLRVPSREGTDTIEPVQDAPPSDTDPFGGEGDISTDVTPALPKADPMEADVLGDDEVNPFDDEGPVSDESVFDEPEVAPPIEEPPFDAVDEASPFDAVDEESPFEETPAEPPVDAEPPAGGDVSAEVDDLLKEGENLFGEE